MTGATELMAAFSTSSGLRGIRHRGSMEAGLLGPGEMPPVRGGSPVRSDPAEPVVDVVDLAGLGEPGLGEERNDAIVEVAGDARAFCHPGAHLAGQVPEGVGRAVAVCGVSPRPVTIGCRRSGIGSSGPVRGSWSGWAARTIR